MTQEIRVQLEFTPNPDTLKYATSLTLSAHGTVNVANLEEAREKSPLAEVLFQFTEVSNVMVGRDFVTVTVGNQERLMELNDLMIKSIQDFLASGKQVVFPQKKEITRPLSEIEQKICEILDKEVRPAVAMDGGDITFEKFEDGFVFLKMQGSCSGCPSSLMTLKMGVESRLKDAIPEVQEVIPV
jgi:Fe-S cluster biogenesis protein NfuA